MSGIKDYMGCAKCKKFILKTSKVCEYCGHPTRDKKKLFTSRDQFTKKPMGGGMGMGGGRSRGTLGPVTKTLLILLGLFYLAQNSVGAHWMKTIEYYANSDETYLGLYILGAMDKDMILSFGEFWRFGTPAFYHGGLIHILMNGYWLYILGPTIERAYGSRRLLLLFLITALTGACGTFFWQYLRDFGVPSIGASGAIFGLIGFMMAPSVWKFSAPLAINPAMFFRQNMFIFIFMFLFMPNIDHAGHIGGLIGGILIGRYTHGPQSDDNTPLLKGLLFIFIAGTLACLVTGFLHQQSSLKNITIKKLEALNPLVPGKRLETEVDKKFSNIEIKSWEK